MPDFSSFARALGVSFANPELLVEALTHRSYINEHKSAKAHNERLEFLGDAVLELATTRFLFDKFPEKPEGDLTAYRAALVNTNSIADVAEALGVNDQLLLSKGEKKDTGRARKIILANAFEAIVGALYLDQGYDTAASFIAKHLFPKIDDVLASRSYQDAKSRFQEAAQEKKGTTPHYKTIDEDGPDHDKHFTVGAFLGTEEYGQGTGKSKQDAEQSAAQNALEKTGW
jgi:ribonuclease-3